MKRGELRKLSDSARRKVSRNFGFRQSGYINWIVKDGYFFCLQHLGFASVYLEAKPMYADDLWWDQGTSTILGLVSFFQQTYVLLG